jgi:hypothetical protein
VLRFIESSKLPTRWGTFDIHGFEDPFKGKEHIAITMGDCAADEPLLIRIHSEFLNWVAGLFYICAKRAEVLVWSIRFALITYKTRVLILLKLTSVWVLALICVIILSAHRCSSIWVPRL